MPALTIALHLKDLFLDFCLFCILRQGLTLHSPSRPQVHNPPASPSQVLGFRVYTPHPPHRLCPQDFKWIMRWRIVRPPRILSRAWGLLTCPGHTLEAGFRFVCLFCLFCDFFVVLGIKTQGLTQAKQALHHWATSPSHCFFILLFWQYWCLNSGPYTCLVLYHLSHSTRPHFSFSLLIFKDPKLPLQ
jgi:hypothetical protein